jgi:hypothetical protein
MHPSGLISNAHAFHDSPLDTSTTHEQARSQGALKEKQKKRGCLPTYLFLRFLRFSGLILENIFMVFLGSSCRETAKNAIKKKSMGKDERIFFPSQLFRPKVFDIDFPQQVFYGVFELPLLRNAQKRHKKNLKN